MVIQKILQLRMQKTAIRLTRRSAVRSLDCSAFIETLLGKGFDIRIFDRHVSLARLTGANKEYIEKGIPHISRLLAACADELLASSDVLVVGNRDEGFHQVLSCANGSHTIVDLVRIMDCKPPNVGRCYGICW